jgi:hypothetical protein
VTLTVEGIQKNMQLQEDVLTDIEPLETEASTVQKIVSFLIDFGLEIGSLILFFLIIPNNIHAYLYQHKPLSNYVVVFVWIIAYRLITILLFDRTIGMAICKTKYLNDHFQLLSSEEKMIAIIGVRTKKIKMCKA